MDLQNLTNAALYQQLDAVKHAIACLDHLAETTDQTIALWTARRDAIMREQIRRNEVKGVELDAGDEEREPRPCYVWWAWGRAFESKDAAEVFTRKDDLAEAEIAGASEWGGQYLGVASRPHAYIHEDGTRVALIRDQSADTRAA